MRSARLRLLGVVLAGGVVASSPAAFGSIGGHGRPTTSVQRTQQHPSPWVDPRTGRLVRPDSRLPAPKPIAPYVDPDRVRTRVPANRYAPAGGCYVLRSAATGRYLVRSGDGFAATGPTRRGAEAVHFQAFDLGKYLLYADHKDFLAMAGSPLGDGGHAAVEKARSYLRGAPSGGLADQASTTLRAPALAWTGSLERGADTATDQLKSATNDTSIVSDRLPSADAEWVLRPAPGHTFVFELPYDDHDTSDPGPVNPPIAGTLTASRSGGLSVTAGRATGTPARFTLTETTGCAHWPEIGTQITGRQPTGPTPYGEVHGYLDAHLHGMAFEFLGGMGRCARPWHPYGVAYALVDCPDHKPGGHGAVMEAFLSGGNPVDGHDTHGWPTFPYWPHYNSLTHEQVYYTWLERAWRGGLRMYTNLFVENSVLCEVYPYKRNSCDEMASVRLQAHMLHELVRYIDAQSGGPGKGWLRIVTDPFEARRVMNAGRLAVVEGIEVSEPFNCSEYLGVPKCTRADIDKRLDGVYKLGVRQMELTNKFDNALTGVTGDSGTTGLIVNSANRYQTGHYWEMGECPKSLGQDASDETQYNLGDETGQDRLIGRDSIFGAVLSIFGHTGIGPVYPAGPQCNERGLTSLGRYAIGGLMSRGMIFDPDHMSALARQASMRYVASRGYSGVVSSHSWADDPTYKSVLRLGGVVTPHKFASADYVAEWQKLRSWADPRFLYGIGYGSDVNGFSSQPGPRNPKPGDGVRYPFVGFGGVIVHKQRSGKRVYDVNVDGVDHYGLWPDYFEDVAIVAGPDRAQLLHDMSLGPEAYLEAWERAIGIAPDACRSDVADVSNGELENVHRGMTPEHVLMTLGQPHTRAGHAFTYCTTDGRVTLRFSGAGHLTSVD